MGSLEQKCHLNLHKINLNLNLNSKNVDLLEKMIFKMYVMKLSGERWRVMSAPNIAISGKLIKLVHMHMAILGPQGTSSLLGCSMAMLLQLVWVLVHSWQDTTRNVKTGIALG